MNQNLKKIIIKHNFFQNYNFSQKNKKYKLIKIFVIYNKLEQYTQWVICLKEKQGQRKEKKTQGKKVL